MIVAGKYQFKPPFPFSPGSKVSGVIAETGREVTDLNVGDQVMAALAVRRITGKLVLTTDRG